MLGIQGFGGGSATIYDSKLLGRLVVFCVTVSGRPSQSTDRSCSLLDVSILSGYSRSLLRGCNASHSPTSTGIVHLKRCRPHVCSRSHDRPKPAPARRADAEDVTFFQVETDLTGELLSFRAANQNVLARLPTLPSVQAVRREPSPVRHDAGRGWR